MLCAVRTRELAQKCKPVGGGDGHIRNRIGWQHNTIGNKLVLFVEMSPGQAHEVNVPFPIYFLFFLSLPFCCFYFLLLLSSRLAASISFLSLSLSFSILESYSRPVPFSLSPYLSNSFLPSHCLSCNYYSTSCLALTGSKGRWNLSKRLKEK